MTQTKIEITENNISDIGFNRVKCSSCLFSNIDVNSIDSYGKTIYEYFCNYYDKEFNFFTKNETFSIPIINKTPDFCKVKNIIVEEE